MATTVRELLVKLGVKADDRKLKQFDAGLATVKKGMLVAAAAAAALAAGLAAITLATARQGDEAAKAGKRVGVTAEEIQELGFAAEQSGASVGDMEKALRRQAVSARDASRGSELAAESYAKIGVDVKDANGEMKSNIDLLLENADGIASLKTETEKLAVVNDIFGRGGAKLLPLFNEGAAGIEKLRQRARDLGFVMSKEATEAAERFTDRLNELKKIAAGVRNQIGIALMPIITRLIDRFRDWFVSNRAIIDQRLDDVVERITDTVEALGVAFEKVDKAVKDGPGSWGVVFRQVGKVLGAAGLTRILLGLIGPIKAVGTAIFAAFSFLLANPVTLVFIGIAAAILAVVLVVEDLVVFMQGGNSAFGRFADTFKRSQPIFDAAWRVLTAAGAAMNAIGAAAADLIVQIPGVTEAVEFLGLAWDVVVGGLKIGFDLGFAGFLLSIELGLLAIADGFDLVNLLASDFNGFMSEILGRGGDAAGVASSVFGGSAQRNTGTFFGGIDAGVAGLAGGAGGGLAGLSSGFGPRPQMEGSGITTSSTVNQAGITINVASASSAQEIAAEVQRVTAADRKLVLDALRGGDR